MAKLNDVEFYDHVAKEVIKQGWSNLDLELLPKVGDEIEVLTAEFGEQVQGVVTRVVKTYIPYADDDIRAWVVKAKVYVRPKSSEYESAIEYC